MSELVEFDLLLQSGGKSETLMRPMIISLVFREFITMSFSWVHSIGIDSFNIFWGDSSSH